MKTVHRKVIHNTTKKLRRNLDKKRNDIYYKSILKNASISKPSQGWTHITIKGEPFERGFQHGHLLRTQFKYINKVLTFIVKKEFHTNITEYTNTCAKLITPQIAKHYPEFLEEITGIAKGANVSVDFLIAWNSVLSMYSYYDNLKPGKNGKRCSAFIACGNATLDGKIVMAHNTHSDYATGPLANIVMRVIPSTGHSFVMQTYAGYIASGTDWFLCDTGIIGCETTISETNYIPQFGTPYFCRIRQAMQYGTTLDEYAEIMLKHNAGDYACSWLFGDINLNQIMLCEIGLHQSNIEKTNDGIYYGMNSAIGLELRKTETDDNTFEDLSESSGARNARLNALLTDKYYGKIDVTVAKRIISDHYDTNENEVIPSSLTICKHTELDSGAKRPFYPWGCVDGKITTSSMAQNMEFLGRQGAACGTAFIAKTYIKKHPEYVEWKPVLRDMPTYNWIKL